MRCGKERPDQDSAKPTRHERPEHRGRQNRGKTLNTMANKNLNLPTLVRQRQRHKPDAPISVVTCCDKQRNSVGKQIVKKKVVPGDCASLNRLKIWRLLGLLSRTNENTEKPDSFSNICSKTQDLLKIRPFSLFLAFPRFSSLILAYPRFSSLFLAYPRLSSLILAYPCFSSLILAYPRLSSLILAYPRSSLLILDCPRSAAAKNHDLGFFSLGNR